MFPRAPFSVLRGSSLAWPAIAALTRRILILISDSVARSASFRGFITEIHASVIKDGRCAIGIASPADTIADPDG